ncbi:MAG: papain-like cysteine protease family protein, partial [Ramlibacter sp.]
MHLPAPLARSAALALFVVFMPLHAAAETRCGPSAESGMERCVSGLPAAALASMRQRQKASNWCWAASISMVLGSHGLRISQEEVVRAEFGEDANVALPADAVSRLLTRHWTDTDGQVRAVSASALPSWRQDQGLAAPEVVEDLAQGRPLILGADRHAVVLVQLVYERPADPQAALRTAIRPLRAVVLDPATDTGVRSARATEWRPDYLARVDVEA